MTAVEVARFEQLQKTEIYEDDFEKELDAFIENEETAVSVNQQSHTLLDKGYDGDFEKGVDDELETMEKGQLETLDKTKEVFTTDDATRIQTRHTDKIEDDQSNNNNDNSARESGGNGPLGEKSTNFEESQSGEPTEMERSESRSPADDSETVKASDGGQSDISTDNEEDHDYDFTEDQIRAMMELEKLKTLLGYTEEDPPEYNVKERIKQLNEELASEPMPEENERAHKVGFKDNLVDLVVPPVEYDEEESPKDKDENSAGDVSDSATNEESGSDDKSENVGSGNVNGSDGEKKHKVLIEREGRFELVSADDIHAIDLGMSMVEDGEGGKPDNKNPNDKNNSNSGKAAEKDVLHPQPPSSPRPATASSGGRRNVRLVAQTRPRSALVVNHGSTLDSFNYTSPYALTPDQKRRGREQSEERKEREKNEEECKKREEYDKVKENDEAFEAWLRQKREAAVQDRENRSRDRNSEVKKGEQRQEYFKEWLETKREQKKKEKLLKQREQQEQMSGKTVRTRQECNQAFREWVNRKNRESFTNKLIERQRARVYHLSARRSRKSQALARALHQAHSFKYLDYYGYRY